jgi:catalase-peroxidase
VPAGRSQADRRQGRRQAQDEILSSVLSISQLVSTAWASASTFRGSDKRGGANGARIRLAPQKDWEVNNPKELAKTLKIYEKIQKEFNGSAKGGKKVSIADLIVLGGDAAIEQAAKNAGVKVTVPFTPGRTGCVAGADGHRDLLGARAVRGRLPELPEGQGAGVDRGAADRQGAALTLTAPEMTVLVGGMRVLAPTPARPSMASSPRRRMR